MFVCRIGLIATFLFLVRLSALAKGIVASCPSLTLVGDQNGVTTTTSSVYDALLFERFRRVLLRQMIEREWMAYCWRC